MFARRSINVLIKVAVVVCIFINAWLLYKRERPSLSKTHGVSDMDVKHLNGPIEVKHAKTETMQENKSHLTKAAESLVAKTAVTKPQKPLLTHNRANAAFVTLIRNSELDNMLGTIEHMEKRFNHRFGYPYVFLNDEDFTKEFKERIQAKIPDRDVKFGVLPREHWSYPKWINQTFAAECRKDMEKRDIIYGGSESYRHMCRYQSGFFFRHPLLAGYDYYWRIEPETRLLCDVPQDPFALMKERNAKYGFTIMIKEYKETIPTLWKTTLQFAKEWKKMHPSYNPTTLKFFGEEKDDGYNLCHYWSNFEIGSLKWLNSDEYLSYFNYLDREGGFFYERWGDAPVHSIAAGLFLKKEEIIFFDQVGYFHNPFSHCPKQPAHDDLKCDCEISKAITEEWWSCVPQWREYKESKWFTD